MLAPSRYPFIGFVAAASAGAILFAAYCSLHALVSGVSLHWTKPVFWGLMTGTPAAGIGLIVWRSRHRHEYRMRVFAVALFAAATLWGTLARGVLAPGGLPAPRELLGQMFIVMPVAAALACVLALLIWRNNESKRRETKPPWIPLPEEPCLRLRSDQVSYVSAAGNYCELHTANRVHLVRVPLKEMADRLHMHGFARVHRSALVNLDALESIERLSSGTRPIARLRCGTTIPVGRRFQAAVLTATSCR